MTKASVQQHAFNAGELSPLMLGRQDVDKTASGLATCTDALLLAQGAWTRRGGSAFLKATKFGGTRESRLIRFQFNAAQAYMLEFGHLYIRFFTQGGILTNAAQTITGITAANPGVITIAGHGYSNGDRLLIVDGGGVTQLNEREVIVANQTTNTFEITDIYGTNIDTTNFDAYSTGGSVAEIFEIVTTYEETDVKGINFQQSADELYLFHTDFAVTTLTRTAALSWTLANVSFIDGPYLALNAGTTTLTLSGTSGSVTVTASAVTDINQGQGFLTTDVGRLIRWKDPAGNWTWLEITARASTTAITATIFGPNASAGTATADWRLGVFSDTTGHPTTGVFYEDRLWLAGAETAGLRIDGSKTALYADFTPTAPDGTVADDNAISFTLAGGQINIIKWLQIDEKGLLVGSIGGEWVVRPSSLGEALTPSNITAKQSSTYGSKDAQPVKVGNAVLYIQKSGRKLRELAYVFESDGFRSPDMTLLSEHVTRPGIDYLTYQQEPQSIIWARRTDGVLLAFTYVRDQNVLAWSRNTLTGPGTAGGAIAQIESIEVIPSNDGTYDELYVIVKRYINGITERYIEVVSKVWESGDDQIDAFHVDCGATYVLSPAANTITGLHYLEGETLSVWADGTVHPDVTVTNGTVTLNSTYSVVTLGYGFNSDGELMPFDGGSRDGSSQGKKKKINRVGFWLMDTLGLKYGKDANSLTEILVRKWGANWGEATQVFTGVVRKPFESQTDRLGQIYFRADTTAPATVLAIMPQGTTEDDS